MSENSVPLFTQWFCWSLSLWKMAISLGIYPIFRQTHIILFTGTLAMDTPPPGPGLPAGKRLRVRCRSSNLCRRLKWSSLRDYYKGNLTGKTHTCKISNKQQGRSNGFRLMFLWTLNQWHLHLWYSSNISIISEAFAEQESTQLMNFPTKKDIPIELSNIHQESVVVLAYIIHLCLCCIFEKSMNL